ncbi:MAG: hypothetical protein WEA56_13550 [Balneolaceae bacterium]
MIRIDPARHMEILVGIIQTKYLVVVFLIGYLIPFLAVIFYFLIPLFLYVFPFYMMFTLFINEKTGWAGGLVLWMGLSFIPMLSGSEYDHLRYLYGQLPLLFLVVYCVVLNIKLRDWGFRETGSDFPLWF